jgi:hypothetical protein
LQLTTLHGKLRDTLREINDLAGNAIGLSALWW